MKNKTSTGTQLDTKEFKKSSKKLKRLAKMEHGRWVVERLMQGWTFDKVKSKEKKKSPYLVEWDSLPDDIKEYDLIFVQNYSRILNKNGEAIFKLKR